MSCLKTPLRSLLVALLALAAGVAHAQAGDSDFTARARAWLAGRYQVSPASVGVQALDARVQSRGCTSGWQFDQPFAGNDGMLRARCPDSGWQVFVKVTLPAQAVAPAQAAPAQPAGAPIMVAAPVQPGMNAGMVQQPFAQPLVRRGQTVLTTWSSVPGLQIAARLEAMDDGRMGEIIRLKNRDSGRIVSAMVNGQNTAQGL